MGQGNSLNIIYSFKIFDRYYLQNIIPLYLKFHQAKLQPLQLINTSGTHVPSQTFQTQITFYQWHAGLKISVSDASDKISGVFGIGPAIFEMMSGGHTFLQSWENGKEGPQAHISTIGLDTDKQ